MNWVAKVTIIGWTLKIKTRDPLNSPQIAPNPKPNKIAIHGVTPARMRVARKKEINVICLPTEISICPDPITNDIPTANIPK